MRGGKSPSPGLPRAYTKLVSSSYGPKTSSYEDLKDECQSKSLFLTLHPSSVINVKKLVFAQFPLLSLPSTQRSMQSICSSTSKTCTKLCRTISCIRVRMQAVILITFSHLGALISIVSASWLSSFGSASQCSSGILHKKLEINPNFRQ